MKNNHKLLIAFFSVVLVILAACGNSVDEPDTESDDNAAAHSDDNADEQEDTSQETEADSSEDIFSKQEEEKKDNPSEEPLEEYEPSEADVVFNDNVLKNKDTLENFIEVAGENGENNESEIKVVKDEGEKGVLIYDLKSRYDEDADQGWIDVFPDLSYYRTSENEGQDVFNNARQQCGYMEKDEIQGFYKLYECRTHWEYHLIPMVDADE
ncbi:hypothetical protein ACDX78_19640 [Virgibacillus oceani]